MDFFGLGFGEIIVILIVAVIFLGPDKLPETAINIARFFRKFKETISNVKENIQREIDIEGLKKTTQEYKERIEENINEIKNKATIHEVGDDVRDAFKEITEGLSQAHPDALTTPRREIVEFPKKNN
ncbi:MAG: Sec-independent protein translocase protein TatB [Campylobacterales bacterium]